jgi:hypothetical protein
MSYFLNESFLVRGDEYFMAVCNKTGAIAIYNEDKNLFLSPFADGPVNFHTNPDGSLNIKNISKFGRSFSLLRIPYSFKLLIQELQAMNIQMRIITDDNVDQLLSLSFSNNIGKLLHSEYTELESNIFKVKSDIKTSLTKDKKQTVTIKELPEEVEAFETFEETEIPLIPIDIKENPEDSSQINSTPYEPEIGPRTPSNSPPPSSEEVNPPNQSTQVMSILEVEQPPEKINEESKTNESNNSSVPNQGEKKVIITDLGNSSSETESNTQETKKIIL